MKKLTAGDITPIMLVCLRNKGQHTLSKLSEVADAVVEYYKKATGGVDLYASLGIYTATNQPLITRYTFEALNWAKKMNFAISLGRDQYRVTGAGEVFSYTQDFDRLLRKSLDKLHVITGNIEYSNRDAEGPVQQESVEGDADAEAVPQDIVEEASKPRVNDIVFPRGQEKAYLTMIRSVQCFGSYAEDDSACKACFLSSVCKGASYGA